MGRKNARSGLQCDVPHDLQSLHLVQEWSREHHPHLPQFPLQSKHRVRSWLFWPFLQQSIGNFELASSQIKGRAHRDHSNLLVPQYDVAHELQSLRLEQEWSKVHHPHLPRSPLRSKHCVPPWLLWQLWPSWQQSDKIIGQNLSP